MLFARDCGASAGASKCAHTRPTDRAGSTACNASAQATCAAMRCPACSIVQPCACITYKHAACATRP
eukprot:14291139-Alexandrium_andersonii.AAC.1